MESINAKSEKMLRVSILTVSDRSSRGERNDLSGPAISNWLADKGSQIVQTKIVADEPSQIRDTLATWADNNSCDLVLTTGGTGVSPRDITPETTATILDRELPGFGELMRLKSLEKTPMAIISRAIAGIRQNTLIVNLPGSPKAALENLEAIWPAVPHTIEKIQGDTQDCGRIL